MTLRSTTGLVCMALAKIRTSRDRDAPPCEAEHEAHPIVGYHVSCNIICCERVQINPHGRRAPRTLMLIGMAFHSHATFLSHMTIPVMESMASARSSCRSAGGMTPICEHTFSAERAHHLKPPVRRSRGLGLPADSGGKRTPGGLAAALNEAGLQWVDWISLRHDPDLLFAGDGRIFRVDNAPVSRPASISITRDRSSICATWRSSLSLLRMRRWHGEYPRTVSGTNVPIPRRHEAIRPCQKHPGVTSGGRRTR